MSNLDAQIKIHQILAGRTINTISKQERAVLDQIDGLYCRELENAEFAKTQPIEFVEKLDVSNYAGCTDVPNDIGLRTAMAHCLNAPDLRDAPAKLQDLYDSKMERIVQKNRFKARAVLEDENAVWTSERPSLDELTARYVEEDPKFKLIDKRKVFAGYQEHNATVKSYEEQIADFMEETGATIEQVKEGNPEMFSQSGELKDQYKGGIDPAKAFAMQGYTPEQAEYLANHVD